MSDKNHVWNGVSGVSNYVTNTVRDMIDKKHEPTLNQKEYTPYVYLTVSHEKDIVGDIIIQLYDIDLPRTTSNFRSLCKTKQYTGTPFHRVIKGFMVQGGDTTKGDGTGGTSIYGDTFEDEGFIYQNHHGTISMANGGPDTNNSQFFINTCVTGNHHLDLKHVVFGIVIHGMETVEWINSLPTISGGDTPISEVTIVDSGEIWLDEDDM
jgi:cyclophilin family peptidyl-prolyl cis-trans isomerase